MSARDFESSESGDRNESLPAQLASELTRLRQRGIDRVAMQRDRQHPVATPLLNRLSREAGFVRATQAESLHAYLDDRLSAYAERVDEHAQFIRELYFDSSGRSPGPGGPSNLLSRSRREHHVGQDTFRKLQRQQLVAFATFLLATPPPRPGRRLTIGVLVSVIVVMLTMLVLLLLLLLVLRLT